MWWRKFEVFAAYSILIEPSPTMHLFYFAGTFEFPAGFRV
jgi:hypothetical protein